MASSIVTSSFKPLAMSDCSSSTTIFSPTYKTRSSSTISLATRRINLPLSFSRVSLSLKSKTHLQKSPFVSFVAQTSDWAEEEAADGSNVALEDPQTESGDESDVADEEPETEATFVDEVVSEEESETEEVVDEEEAETEVKFVDEVVTEPPEEAKLFVGNLAYDVDSQGLAMLFEQAGTVEIAEVIYNRETDQSRGFGFVTMSTVQEAESAVEKFNRYDLKGRALTVNKAAPRGSRPERQPRVYEPAFRVYVGNLPWDVDNSKLEQVFSEHGKVLEARVVTDRETGRSRGFGFVTMSTEDEVNDTIAALDGQNMEGRAIRVNVAEERPRRGY